jgi:hypothetical protein
MAHRKVQVGDGLVSRTAIRDRNGALYSPAVVELLVRSPSGTESAIDTTEVEVGRYEAAWVVTEPGVWYRRWRISGGAVAVDEAPVVVAGTQFAAP